MSDDPAAVEESTAESAEGSEADGEASEADVADSGDEASTEFGPAVEQLLDALDDEELAGTARDLGERVAELEAELDAKDEEIDEVTDKLARSRADFQNYKKRSKKQQDQIEQRATADLVSQFTTVRQNLVRALDQEEDADIRPGVESTLEEFDSILDSEGVEIISPELGEPVDPTRHEVMMRVDSDQPAGTIADVYQEGYALDDQVLQAAQVTVSEE